MRAYSYSDWAEILAGFFFDEAHDGDEILFAVDDLSLAEASGLAEDEACESLSAAVRSVVGFSWRLSEVSRRVRRWRHEGCPDAHPALPVLAVTVLAAARMGEDQEVARHNYYVPLRRLLNPKDHGVGAPGSFTEYIGILWRDVARWANGGLGGRRGRLVVRDPGHFAYIGYATQHAVVKSGDLRHLDSFFRRIGLEPGETVAAAELRRALSAWTAGRSEPWARRLWKVSSEPEFHEHCEALLEREAQRWDGRPRDPRTGRAIGRVRIAIQSTRRPSPFLCIQWDDRLPEGTSAALPTGEVISLRRWEGWYQPCPLPSLDIEDCLWEGLELQGEGCRFRLPLDDVHALGYDDDLGAWASVERMAYGDRYQLLVWHESTSEVVDFLLRTAAPGLRVEAKTHPLLPDDWELLRDVQLDARPTEAPPASLGALIPAGPGPRLRLLGGLRLGTAAGVYLRGGEPQVALSSVANDPWVVVKRLGTNQEERLRADERREIELWRLQLEPDRYEVAHGQSRAVFQIVDGIAETAGPGAGTVHQAAAGEAAVVGTTVEQAGLAPQPVTVPVPKEGTVRLLGPNAEDYCSVELPQWTERLLGIPRWQYIDAWADFDVAWVLSPNGDGTYEAAMMNAIEPATERASSTWARLVDASALSPGQPREVADLWRRYASRAGQA